MKTHRVCIPRVFQVPGVIIGLFTSWLELRDIVRVRRTCHVAAKYLEDAIPGKLTVKVTDTVGWHDAIRLLSFLSRLERLEVDNRTVVNISMGAVLESCPRLLSLQLLFSEGFSEMSTLGLYPSLCHLSMNFIKYSGIGCLPPTLTSLTCHIIIFDPLVSDTDVVWEHLLSLPLRRFECPIQTVNGYSSSLTPKRVSTLFARFAPVLTHFCWGFSDSMSEYPCHRWPQLESLSLMQPVSWDKVWSTFDVSDNTCLTRLKIIEGIYGLIPPTILHLSLLGVDIQAEEWKRLAREHGHTLRSLEVDVGNWNFLREFTQLRSLTVHEMTVTERSSFSMFPPCLTHLDLFCPLGMSKYLDSLPRTLVVVKLSCRDRVTYTDLHALGDHCPALVDIELSGLHVTRAAASIPLAIDKWLRTCTNLQRISISYCRLCGGENQRESMSTKVEHTRRRWDISIRVTDCGYC